MSFVSVSSRFYQYEQAGERRRRKGKRMQFLYQGIASTSKISFTTTTVDSILGC